LAWPENLSGPISLLIGLPLVAGLRSWSMVRSRTSLRATGARPGGGGCGYEFAGRPRCPECDRGAGIGVLTLAPALRRRKGVWTGGGPHQQRPAAV